MKSNILTNLKKLYYLNPENYVLLIFTLVSSTFLLNIVGGSAWLTIAFLFAATIFLWLKLHDLIISFLLMAIFSLQFYIPNKYYSVEVFKPYELLNGVGSYLLSYGVNLKNIFLLIALILIIRNIILKKGALQKSKLTFLVPIIISALIFFLVSLYSSLHFSPYINLSLTWLLHYIQMFILSFLILYIYLVKPKNFELIIPTIISSILLESAISIIQFAKQSWAGLSIESAKYTSAYYGAPDAVHTVFRIAGAFGQSNQFALIMIVMLILIIPRTIEKKQPLYIFGSLISLIIILLTQSRSGWISLSAVALITIAMYKKELLKLVSILGVRRTYISIILIVLATSFVVIPRIIGSFNAFDEGAGVPLRTEMIKEAGLAISQNPWVGYGIGTNEPVLLNLFPRGYNYSFPAPVHMAYAQLLLESGILGLISFLFPYIYIIRCIINQYLISGTKKMEKIKNYTYITLAGITTFALFYLFQPHEGIRDFYYLGIILGYGLINLYTFKAFKK